MYVRCAEVMIRLTDGEIHTATLHRHANIQCGFFKKISLKCVYQLKCAKKGLT